MSTRGEVHPGEELRTAEGFPALVRYFPGGPERPLVVFITGGGVLARIAYGHPGARPEDFLAYWMQAAGHPFLALTYPLDHPVFPSAHPGFAVRDWGAQSAEIVAQIIRSDRLPPAVTVLAWSMAGRIAKPLNEALRARGVALELFVAMAAITPFPNLLPMLGRGLQPDAAGYTDASGPFNDWLLACLHDQNKRAGHIVVTDEAFRRDFLGDFPVNLAATDLRYREGAFVYGPLEDFADTGAFEYEGFPPIGLMLHSSALDPRHALMDQGMWSAYITTRLLYDCTATVRPGDLPEADWQALVALVREAPARLSVAVGGNHMFFLGEAGAMRTVEALAELRDRAAGLSQELARCLGP